MTLLSTSALLAAEGVASVRLVAPVGDLAHGLTQDLARAGLRQALHDMGLAERGHRADVFAHERRELRARGREAPGNCPVLHPKRLRDQSAGLFRSPSPASCSAG